MGRFQQDLFSLFLFLSETAGGDQHRAHSLTCHEAVSGVNLRLVVTRAVRTLGAAPADLEMLKTLADATTLYC